MPNIERREGKDGITFRITVSGGFDTQGKRIRHRMTYTPAPGMTPRQMEKAAQRAAADFERSIEQGYLLDQHQTFSEYADYVLSTKAHNGELKTKTLERYRELLDRINQAIGHMKLKDIRPQHLNSFYRNLAEDGIRLDGTTATPMIDFPKLLKKQALTRATLAQKAGIAAATVTVVCKGNSVRAATAQAIAEALGKQVKELFTLCTPSGGLSPKTIQEHHRLISSVLAQAEKEMLVPYNAAEKASPPRVQPKQPNYFQPGQIADILEALESEPLKWRTITHMMIVTGCRRGEVMGLKWEKVDFENRRIKVDTALLISKEKGIYETTTKTGDIRYLNIPAETVELLKRYRKDQLRLKILNGDRWIETGYVFTTDSGQPIRPDEITAWLSDFSKRHNLPHINPHAFRHTVASVLIANGTDVVTVSKQLGHSSVNTTESFYSHIIEENKAKATECIADTLLRKKA